MSEPGKCLVCGCTEEAACSPPCAWANPERTLCTKCAGVPLHQESLSSVALDGARIACFVARNVIAADGEFGFERRAYMLEQLANAADALDQARDALPVVTTSIHQVSPAESAIILAP